MLRQHWGRKDTTNLGRWKQGEVGDRGWGGAFDFHRKFLKPRLWIINHLQEIYTRNTYVKRLEITEQRKKELCRRNEEVIARFWTSSGLGEVAMPSEFWSDARQTPCHSPGLNATTWPFPWIPNALCIEPPPIETRLCQSILHRVREEDGGGARAIGNAANRVEAPAMGKTLW